MSLLEYQRKRDFKKSAEPRGRPGITGARRHFVIQKHAASRLHYDFRLALGGTLKSWAVPKGIPYAKGEKRLAVQVEDHPLSYGNFEGTIPKGQYGGGTVMLWDNGTYSSLSGDPLQAWKAGKIHFLLSGQKLQGEWYLVRLREEKQWLLIRGGPSLRPLSKTQDDRSVLSGKTMAELAASPSGARVDRRTKNSDIKLVPRHAEGTTAAPTPTFVEPMLAKSVSAPPAGDWMYEIKFDGFRALALKQGRQVALRSRNNKDLGERFPAIREAIAQLNAGQLVLDGEIVALDAKGRPAFQLLQALEPGVKPPRLFFYAFDLLQWEGKSLLALPLRERKSRLEEILKRAPPSLRFSASLKGDVKTLLAQAARLGLEGLIGKRPNAGYEAGRRSGAWIKLKLNHQQEMVIGGYTLPAGTRKYLGALLVGYYEQRRLIYAGRVGTGFDARLLRAVFEALEPLSRPACPFVNLPEKRPGRYSAGITVREMRHCRWVEPKLVCQAKFSEWTRDGKLRHPVFLGLRDDKQPAEVVRETTGTP